MNIKINVREDSIGCLYLTPVKQSYIDQIIEYLKEFNVDYNKVGELLCYSILGLSLTISDGMLARGWNLNEKTIRSTSLR